MPGGRLFSEEPNSLQRRWLAIALSTMAMQFSYWSFAFAATTPAGGEDAPDAFGPFALGLAIMPMVFIALAFLSRHRRAPMAVLKAMGLFLVVAMPLALLDVVVGIASGFAAGGVVALRREEEVHSLKWRWIAVGATAVYLAILVVLGSVSSLMSGFAVMSGAVLPFTVHGIVDQITEAYVEEESARTR